MRGAPPAKGSPVSFSLMLNLVSAANASDKAILWGFLSRYICPGRRPRPSRCSTGWPTTRSTTTKTSCGRRSASAPPDARERAALPICRRGCGPCRPTARTRETIQNEVYEAGKDAGFEPLRAWFPALYEVLLGQSQGPRFGSFAPSSAWPRRSP